MKRKKNRTAKVFCALMAFALLNVGAGQRESKAAEVTVPYVPQHEIKAYLQKNLYETETVKVTGIEVREITDPDTKPVTTQVLTKPVKFQIYNTTLQKLEQEVTSQNGKLPELDLIRNHNYTIFAVDSEYKMPNAYVWAKDNGMVDIKDTIKTYTGTTLTGVTYNYPQVKSLNLTRRDKKEPNPEKDRRVSIRSDVRTEGGASMSNIHFVLTSDVETVRAVSDARGRLNVDLLEDVNYTVSVEEDLWSVASFPISVKDKSEYDAKKYGYNHANCQRVDEITLVSKKSGHKKDTILTNSNYGGTIYADMAGSTSIEGMDFQHFLLSERELTTSGISALEGKDCQMFDMKLVNPHRWEVAKMAAGEYTITKQVKEEKAVKQVFYLDGEGTLQKVDFKQNGSKVTFQMQTLSLYPVVIEYGDGPVPKDDPQPEDPQEHSRTTLKVRVTDKSGKPVQGALLYLKSSYGKQGDKKFQSATDAEGRASYVCDNQELNDDEYRLLLVEGSPYTMDRQPIVLFETDENWENYVKSVDDVEYEGEITLTVKGGEETEEPGDPEEADFTDSVSSLKEIGTSGGPVTVTVTGTKLPSTLYCGVHYVTKSGVETEVIKSQKVTASGTPEKRTFEIQIPDASKYEEAVEWKVGVDAVPDNGYYFFKNSIKIVRGPEGVTKETKEALQKAVQELESLKKTEYTAGSWQVYQEAVEKGKKLLADPNSKESDCKAALQKIEKARQELKKQPQEPQEPELTNIVPSVTEIGVQGGTVAVIVQGKALPEQLYYGIQYVTEKGEEKSVVDYQAVMAEGTEEQRMFEVKIPDVAPYKEAVKWRIGVDVAANDGYYFFDNAIKIVKETEPAKGEWRIDGKGTWYLNPDGKTYPVSTLKEIDGEFYYFNQAGYASAEKWEQVNGAWYYFGATHKAAKGWKAVGNTWYFFETGTAKMQTGWIRDGETWYFADGNGAMQTGWLRQGNTWYFLEGSGAMKTGWVQTGGKWYYLAESGAMQTGWVKDGDAWYFLDGSGAMKTGWLQQENTWYYLAGNGRMQTGWLQIGENWYFLMENGAMQTGWLQQGNTWYYLKANGVMAAGVSLHVGGVQYRFSGSGAWMR
ncbi:hypothetical protein [Suipraeoptans intestinalis]|uniref:hypothetical protein n=1 Tax=Suipraeoptans intestinalis TaxID=2606628 RepID=UPI0023F11754|nr:hypothetical protein [Suipraeoptans intestinalis]MDD7770087.1 hypothetical protein [Suipraeoptans intestinalis]MDY3122023.1 hypothetical protein [Suipraeoptans intestinalis]